MEGSNEQGAYARKPYLVAWSQRFEFIRQMAGSASQNGGASGGNWIRAVPYAYPDAPWIYAQGCEIKPAGAWVNNSSPISFNDCVVVVNFGPLTWDAIPGDDPFNYASLSADPTENQALQWATQEIDFGYELYPLPTSALKFSSDNLKLTSPVSVRVPVISMSMTWHRYPVMPLTRIANYVGKLNASTFLGRPAQTVFFEAPKTTREMMTDGTIVQKVMMPFRYRSIAWNRFLRPDKIQWDTVVDSTGASPYDTADFGALLANFVPPAPST